MTSADCASDPPLGATSRALAVARADDVLVGLGALPDHGSDAVVRVRHDDAEAAMANAVSRLGLSVAVEKVADVWPGAGGTSAASLVQIADKLRGRPRRCYLTVAGAVEMPSVLAVAPSTTVAELVELAGGAAADWVAVAGGAPAGRLVARDAVADDLGELVLIVPTGHEVVRRLRTPLSVWLQRAASLCGACQVCSDVCPASSDLRASDEIRALIAVGKPSPSLWSCTGCGLCDVMCPSELSPRALLTAVRDGLSPSTLADAQAAEQHRRALAEKACPPLPPGVEPPWSTVPGLDIALLTTRLGLAEYDRQPKSLL